VQYHRTHFCADELPTSPLPHIKQNTSHDGENKMKHIFKPNTKVLMLDSPAVSLNADMEAGQIEHLQIRLNNAELNFFAEDVTELLKMLDSLSAWRMKHTPSRMKNPPEPIWYEMILQRGQCEDCDTFVPWFYRMWDGDDIVRPCLCSKCSGKSGANDDRTIW